MGPSPSRNRVAGVPLGQAFCTSRRVASGIGSSPWGFSDIKHLLSADFFAFSFPYSSRPSLSCLVVRTKFPNRVIYSAGGWGKTRSNVSMCIIAASADDELSQHNPAIERRARFIAATADLSALGGCSDTQMNLLKLHHRARGTLKVHPLVEELLCHLCCSDVKNNDYPHQRKE